MSEKFFSNFPTITYSNNVIVDITKRVALLDRVSKNPYVFYPFTIESNERADQLSYRYYDNPYKSWIIYLGNNIVDPYYEWYMAQDELEQFVEKKYGSLYSAQNKIKCYRNNWEQQEPISKSEYNALTPVQKKYWNPNYGLGSSIVNYTRKETDWYTTTNKIISYQVSNTSFIKDEICTLRLSGEYIGKGQVVGTSNSYVYLQHVYGSFYPSDEVVLSGSSYIYGTESRCNTVVTSATAIANNLHEEEIIYWKPITYYEYEVEKNEFNKTVRLIDKAQAPVVVDNLKTLLEE
jgi:hypothetical protein